MEQAIFISNIEDLRYIDSKYTRLYFGNEFCQNLIPSKEDLEIALKAALERRMEFSLATPYVTDKGIEFLRSLFGILAKGIPGAEVIINDWGALRLLRTEFKGLKPVLGRLLTKQKRGPRILSLKDKVPKDMVCHFMESNIDVPILSDFLIRNGIDRVELDNLLQGLEREVPSLRASLYFPYAYISTTRFCLTASSGKRKGFLRMISDCDRQCHRYSFRLRHKNMPLDLYIRGNTQFFKNDELPSDLERLKIDRIVYEPKIPL